MLVSDRPDLHVFMLERTRAGRVRAGRHGVPRRRRRPADDAGAGRADRRPRRRAASAEHGLARGGLALPGRGGAGVLRGGRDPARTTRPITAARRPRRRARGVARRAQRRVTATLGDVLETEDLVVDARALRVFAHWLTPLGAPRRYDTWFFVARAPTVKTAYARRQRARRVGVGAPSTRSRSTRAAIIDLIFPTDELPRRRSPATTADDVVRRSRRGAARRRPAAPLVVERRERASASRSRGDDPVRPTTRGRSRSPTSTSVTRPDSRPRERRR